VRRCGYWDVARWGKPTAIALDAGGSDHAGRPAAIGPGRAVIAVGDDRVVSLTGGLAIGHQSLSDVWPQGNARASTRPGNRQLHGANVSPCPWCRDRARSTGHPQTKGGWDDARIARPAALEVDITLRLVEAGQRQ
jgi:hypothetical protein